MNRIENENMIKAGQEIKIPLSEASKEKIYDYIVEGIAQNLVYPAKYDAVMHLIDKGFVTEQRQSLSFKKIKVKNGKVKYYTVKPGDTLYRISRIYNISDKRIKQLNGWINVRALPVGAKLVISTEAAMTLRHIAEKERIPLSRLKELNPAVKEFDAPLVEGYEIRI